ncbi:TonB-dependent receptor [Flavobacterium sp.]|uniref:TonB-dependent receptor n=1 Tax=Flavobacterium sp. TaxID=239 RepID=UPI00286E2E9C|nr:TonB-dependent receptor [Flavobacterium sp.]
MIQNKSHISSSASLLSIRLLSISLFLIIQFSFAQKKEENIGTEVVNVVKPYTPTVSDANKINEIPSLEDTETNKKETIKYQIFSFPVASTFTPSKGKAAAVDKAILERLFSNYLTLGFGNYATLNADLFVTHELDKYQYLGAMLRHQSSQGGIKGVVLDDKFAETAADVLYGYQRNDTKFCANLGYKREGYNWYGVPLDNTNFNANLIGNLDPNHQFNTINLGSELTISNSFFNKLNVNFVSFSDNYNSKENRFVIKPDFTFDFGDASVKTKFGVDYLNTEFDTTYLTGIAQVGTNSNIKTSNLIFNINPSFQILKDDLSVELGADVVFYSKGKDVFGGVNNNSSSKFFIYPKINASYKLVSDLMIAFGGAEGKLIQNSYADFTNSNKFLSPTLSIQPTNQQYDVFAGLRGKLSSSLAYNIKASYNATKDKALFKSNPYLLLPIANYSFGNSFTVVYDNVSTATIFGEIKSDINKNVSLGLSAEYNNYNTTFESRAWNLPAVKATFTTDFNIGAKWYAGSQLFYVGERKDEFTNLPFALNADVIKTLDSYFDINAHIGYKYNERLTAFLKGNNLANQNYNRWLNYPVQGAQVILGASYKFDF